MSTWNYRVLAHKESDGSYFFLVHEVYYDKDKNPNGYTERSVGPAGEDMKSLITSYHMIAQAFEKPILLAGGEFPNEYKP
jgi:hypothetical protein